MKKKDTAGWNLQYSHEHHSRIRLKHMNEKNKCWCQHDWVPFIHTHKPWTKQCQITEECSMNHDLTVNAGSLEWHSLWGPQCVLCSIIGCWESTELKIFRSHLKMHLYDFIFFRLSLSLHLNIYTALQKFGNALENGVLDNIGMNPF